MVASFLPRARSLCKVSRDGVGMDTSLYRRLRRGLTLVLVVAGAITFGPTAGAGPTATAPSVVTGHVLIYGPSLADVAGFNERAAARSLGYTVAVADTIAWKALTRADFARYDAIIIGDRGCTAPNRRYLRVAAATRGKWTAAITGNVAIVGTDPAYHAQEGVTGARQLVVNGLKYAAESPTTGAYLSLGCAYSTAARFTPVRLLRGFGPFTVRGQDTFSARGCPDKVEIVKPRNPLVTDLTNQDLSEWGCSIHEGVDSYPYPFTVTAVHRPTSMPYLLTRRPTSAGASDSVTRFSAPASGIPSRQGEAVAPNAGD